MRIKPNPISMWLALPPRWDQPSVIQLQASPHDFGYEIDEEELAGELPAPVPSHPVTREIPEIDPLEFEAIYLWFLT
jgi:hypothetical protein